MLGTITGARMTTSAKVRNMKCIVTTNLEPRIRNECEDKMAKTQKVKESHEKRDTDTSSATTARKREENSNKLALSDQLKEAIATQCGVDK